MMLLIISYRYYIVYQSNPHIGETMQYVLMIIIFPPVLILMYIKRFKPVLWRDLRAKIGIHEDRDDLDEFPDK
jgi:hypothetical protein